MAVYVLSGDLISTKKENKCDGKCIVQDNGYNSPSEKCSM